MWKMTPGAGGLAQAGLRKMSSLSVRRCMEITTWLLEWLQMSWTWTARRCGESLQKIWGWGRSVQKWFWSCWKRSSKSGVCRCVMTSWNNLKPNLLERVITADESGSLSMIWRPSAKVFSRRLRRRWGRRKRGWPGPKLRWCWLLPLMWRALCTQSLPQSQTVNQHIYRGVLWRLMRSVQEKRWHYMYEKKHGCFTTTMFQCTLHMHWASGNFFPK